MIHDGLHHDLICFYVVISIITAFLAKSQDTLHHETGLKFLWLSALPWLGDASANPVCLVYTLSCYVNRPDVTKHAPHI